MQKIKSFSSDIKSKLPPIIIGSFMLVAGLAWNDAATAAINYYVPEKYRNNKNILFKFLYALFISFIVIMIISIFSIVI